MFCLVRGIRNKAPQRAQPTLGWMCGHSPGGWGYSMRALCDIIQRCTVDKVRRWTFLSSESLTDRLLGLGVTVLSSNAQLVLSHRAHCCKHFQGDPMATPWRPHGSPRPARRHLGASPACPRSAPGPPPGQVPETLQLITSPPLVSKKRPHKRLFWFLRFSCPCCCQSS